MLWHCWLGHLPRKIVSELTYNVTSGTLNPTIPYLLLARLKAQIWDACQRRPSVVRPLSVPGWLISQKLSKRDPSLLWKLAPLILLPHSDAPQKRFSFQIKIYTKVNTAFCSTRRQTTAVIDSGCYRQRLTVITPHEMHGNICNIHQIHDVDELKQRLTKVWDKVSSTTQWMSGKTSHGYNVFMLNEGILSI